jgi:hypothetical protein
MSTIYTFHAECSTMDTLASGDELLVYDASSGRTVSCTPADIATYVTGNSSDTGGTFNGTKIFTGGVTMSVSSSVLIGTTLSAKVGFFGKAGTTAATTIAALVTTGTVTGSCVGFSTTASLSNMIDTVNSIISALKDIGIVKT